MRTTKHCGIPVGGGPCDKDGLALFDDLSVHRHVPDGYPNVAFALGARIKIVAGELVQRSEIRSGASNRRADPGAGLGTRPVDTAILGQRFLLGPERVLYIVDPEVAERAHQAGLGAL